MTDGNKLNTEQESGNKPLGFLESFGQAFSLIFAVQNRSGRARLMGLAETNPMPVIIAGVVSMIVFFSFCFISSQLLIHLLTD